MLPIKPEPLLLGWGVSPGRPIRRGFPCVRRGAVDGGLFVSREFERGSAVKPAVPGSAIDLTD